jgi:hypothetical protein
LKRPGLSEEPVDEISVSEENKKVKSTWDTLDVQGSGFELLRKSIVSRPESQDVMRTQGKQKYQTKDEYIQSTVTTSDKSRKEFMNQKYRAISTNITSNVNLQNNDNFYSRKQNKYNIYNKENIGDNSNNMSRKVIIDTKLDKNKKIKGQQIQSAYDKKNMVYINSRQKDNDSEKGSESSSHISKRSILDTKKQEQKKYLLQKIAITPSKEEETQNFRYGYSSKGTKQTQERKYFNKNIEIQPVIIGTKKGEISSTQNKVINIGTRVNITPSINNKRGMRGASTDNKNLVKTIDILKGVKYFTKNIAIEPAQVSKYNIHNISMKDSGKQSGKTTYGKTYSRGAERRTWQIDYKNGEDLNFGRISHDNETINENMLKNIPGIDENTKFYHKEITITPVVLPPLRLSQK